MVRGGASAVGCSRTKNTSGKTEVKGLTGPWVHTKGRVPNALSWGGRQGLCKEAAMGLRINLDRG